MWYCFWTSSRSCKHPYTAYDSLYKDIFDQQPNIMGNLLAKRLAIAYKGNVRDLKEWQRFRLAVDHAL